MKRSSIHFLYIHADKPGVLAQAAFAAAAFVLSLTLTFGAADAQDKTYVMKVTLPTLNDTPHLFAKKFAAAVERDSGGRIKAEVYPASQLGSIPRQIEGTQFGAIQAANIPPEFFVGVDERFEVMAAPGFVDSLEHGQRVAADPAVLKLMLGLGADKGLHGVGLSSPSHPASCRERRSAISSISGARKSGSLPHSSNPRHLNGLVRRPWR